LLRVKVFFNLETHGICVAERLFNHPVIDLHMTPYKFVNFYPKREGFPSFSRVK
jgi:hypothetical protein